MTSRNYCFTLFNITDVRFEELLTSWKSNTNIKYLVLQKEQTPTTNVIHYQGYFECKKTLRATGAKKLLGETTAHIEMRRGTRAEARAYCMKKDTRIDGPWEVNEWKESEQGKRTDLISFVDDIKEGATDMQLLEKHTRAFLSYNNHVHTVRNIYTKRRTEPPKVFYYWGGTGLGKSRRARWEAERLFGEKVYSKDPSHKWWDGYQQEPAVVLDDILPFTGSSGMNVGYLLRLLDRYDVTLEVKGSTIKFTSTYIWITSNYSLDELFIHDLSIKEESKEAFRRRFTEFVEFKGM